jgi:hypothetical protein
MALLLREYELQTASATLRVGLHRNPIFESAEAADSIQFNCFYF